MTVGWMDEPKIGEWADLMAVCLAETKDVMMVGQMVDKMVE